MKSTSSLVPEFLGKFDTVDEVLEAIKKHTDIDDEIHLEKYKKNIQMFDDECNDTMYSIQKVA